jgi:hypothetical protein
VLRINVDLDLPARQRWLEPGREIAHLAQGLASSALEIAEDLLPPFFQPLLKNTKSTRTPNPLCLLISKEMTEEAIGLSEATGIPVTQLVLSNCTYDFTQLCSAAVYQDPQGRPVMIRNMDWDLPEDIAKYTVQVDYVRSGIPAYSSLGFAGFLGVVTALSPAWALAMNQAPSDHLRALHPIKKAGVLSATPTTYAMRQICDRATSFSDLNRGLMKVKSMTPFLALTCGMMPGEGARIERPDCGRATRTNMEEADPLTLTNHYLHAQHQDLNGSHEWVDDEGHVWASDSSRSRLCKMGELAQEFSKKASLPPLSKLRTKPIFWEATVHTAVMRPATGDFRYANHQRMDQSQ